MRVEVCRCVIGDHEQLVDATGENVLLELGIVDDSVSDGNCLDGRIALGLCELSRSFDGVQIVCGDNLMGFGHVERAIGCSCDVLVIGNDLECNDDVHLSTFLYRYFNATNIQNIRPN